MHQLLRLYLAVSSCLAVLALFLLISVRDQPVGPYEPIGLKFQPGHVLSHDMACEPAYDVMDYFHLYCQVISGAERGKIFVTFDIRDMVIVHTTLINPNKTIGDLIVVWGPPKGFEKMILGNYIYWPGRYAFVGGRVFGPGNSVDYIVYDNMVIRSQPWAGFTNQHD